MTATVTRMAGRKRLTVADLTPDEFHHAGTCFHEGAHAVVGTVVGGEVRTAVVGASRWEGLAGAVAFRTRPTREPMMLLAGPYATAKWNAGCNRRPTLREVERVLDDTGHHDRDAITAAGVFVGDIFAEVANLVELCWSPVVDVAVKLHRDGEASDADVLAALGLTAATAAHGLSLIRSGAAPGSFTVSLGVA